MGYQCFPFLKIPSLDYFSSEMFAALWFYIYSSTISKDEEVNITQTNVIGCQYMLDAISEDL